MTKNMWFWPGMTAAATILIGLGANRAIGTVYGEAQAVLLIESLAASGLYLGSAIATASATTLALMLTLLGLTNRADNDFDHDVFVRIERVSILATLSLLGSLFLLVILVLPVGEFDSVPDRWFPTMYNVLFAMTIGVTALLSSTVVLLFLTVRQVVTGITPGEDV